MLCVLRILCGLNFTDWQLMPPLSRHPHRELVGWVQGRTRHSAALGFVPRPSLRVGKLWIFIRSGRFFLSIFQFNL